MAHGAIRGAPCVARMPENPHHIGSPMKFFAHLMPFADLDLDYDRKHNSAWVTLPNSYHDRSRDIACTTITSTS